MGIGTDGQASRRTDTVLKKGRMNEMRNPDGFEFVEIRYTTSDGVNNGKTYSYKTRLDLRLGQRVYAPTYRSDKSEAVVTAINCPDPGFKCREITEVMPETEGEDA